MFIDLSVAKKSGSVNGSFAFGRKACVYNINADAYEYQRNQVFNAERLCRFAKEQRREQHTENRICKPDHSNAGNGVIFQQKPPHGIRNGGDQGKIEDCKHTFHLCLHMHSAAGKHGANSHSNAAD